ncbi:hypothetical protein ACPXBC_30560, partial [Escherichia coli]|uniref:hypothetical protein n=1 Tax=Escherichia coli TaxID=562 RepID=UPI003CE53CF6
LGTMTSPEVATSVVSDVVPPAEIVSEVPASATTDVGLESAIPTDAASTSLEASSAAIPVVEPTIESSEKPANPSEPAV